MSYKPIICIDFDGVIHSYENGWQDGEIYGIVIPGFFEWLDRAKDHFQCVVYSSRSKADDGVAKMQQWIANEWMRIVVNDRTNQKLADLSSYSWHPLDSLEFAFTKPAAFLTIDDRCIRFTGDWTESNLAPENLKRYVPWNKEAT